MATAVEAELMDDDEAIEVPGANALMALNKSEIDMQIATAKRYPRTLSKFRDDARVVACVDPETAGTMFYTLKRKGQDGMKIIRGPSARLAEVAAMCYGNLRYGARVIEITDTQIVAQGFCMDMEKNIGTQVEVRRRITDKNKRKFSEDMIVVTGNAACSIALRNAVFKIIPMALFKPVYDEAMKTSVGEIKSLTETRQKLFEAFTKMGVAPSQILEFCGRRSVEDITIDDIVDLRGLWTAIHDGDTSVEEAFAKESGETKGGIKGQSVKDALGPKTPPASETKPAAKAAPATKTAATTAAPAQAKKAAPAKTPPKPAPEPEPEPEDEEEPVTDGQGEVIEGEEDTEAPEADGEEVADGEDGTDAAADEEEAEAAGEEEFALGAEEAEETPRTEPPRKGGGRTVSERLQEVYDALKKAMTRKDVNEILMNLGDAEDWDAAEYKLAQEACEANYDRIKRQAQQGPPRK